MLPSGTQRRDCASRLALQHQFPIELFVSDVGSKELQVSDYEGNQFVERTCAGRTQNNGDVEGGRRWRRKCALRGRHEVTCKSLARKLQRIIDDAYGSDGEAPERFRITLAQGGEPPWQITYHASNFDDA